MESQDSPHGSSEERGAKTDQRYREEEGEESVMKMKEGAMVEEKDESQCYLKNRKQHKKTTVLFFFCCCCFYRI